MLQNLFLFVCLFFLSVEFTFCGKLFFFWRTKWTRSTIKGIIIKKEIEIDTQWNQIKHQEKKIYVMVRWYDDDCFYYLLNLGQGKLWTLKYANYFYFLVLPEKCVHIFFFLSNERHFTLLSLCLDCCSIFLF